MSLIQISCQSVVGGVDWDQLILSPIRSLSSPTRLLTLSVRLFVPLKTRSHLSQLTLLSSPTDAPDSLADKYGMKARVAKCCLIVSVDWEGWRDGGIKKELLSVGDVLIAQSEAAGSVLNVWIVIALQVCKHDGRVAGRGD